MALGSRTFVALILTVAAFTTSPSVRAAETKHPNIVFLLADQWRAKATGYAGDPNVKTPHLDRLARQSVSFTNAVSVCPVCCPYRAALMTGRYPTSTGIFLNDAYLPDREFCIAEALKQAGYQTAYIGKWHLDGHGRSDYIPPERRQGWDFWMGAECDHDYNKSHYYAGNSSEKKFWPGYDAFAQTAAAQDYLRQHARDAKPFVLMVSYGTPHFPHNTAPQEYKELYPLDKIHLAPNVPPDQQAKARREAQGYYAHCTALDKCVGDVVDTLSATGLAENTILVFTSDHGEMLGAHDCPPWMKQVAWDESARVPFLLRDPRLADQAGRVIRTPLTTPDIPPTLFRLAGVPVPKSFEGEDLSGLLHGTGPGPDRAALYMAVSPFIPRPYGVEYRAVRTSRYTYVRTLDGPWLLFDDQQDPYQMHNLAGQPERAALQQELDGRLQAELKKINDPFRPAQYYLDLWGYDVRPNKHLPYGPGAKVQSPQRRPE
jgi:arylsulfatase A-like enzyme